ncbi:hypothetical protein HNI00_18420 [Thermoleptolyngbya oregonensis NK1-22]|uniref:Uncharacterized protein n=1 Tax=Thermoleptolyngbya oregonensis NK1-22 TaxID=2547457 RepID=A0AA97BDV8_9CYAN|nr:hypothetical protein [Thermoleptolyngbya oregonensis]WOB44904.1 hypothetical protein HNI00_18420 [Thermoleptolyngbya oregonensis NK1-22]
MGDRFPDVTLPNQNGEPITLSSLTQPALVDHYLGFADGFLRLAAIHFRIIMLDSTAWITKKTGTRLTSSRFLFKKAVDLTFDP